tara:strand:+ start:2538 stop:4592 length:2055 start_codon:yes stop_codon:yes gene_type:complete
MKHLLIIEDDKVDQMALERFAKTPEFQYTYQLAISIAEAKLVLKTETFDGIISDYFLGDGTAFEILELNLDIPIIVTTGTGSEEIAVNALKMGAFDYLIKDVDGFYLKMLPITVQNALQRYQSEKELKEYHNNLEGLVLQRTAELKREIEINRESAEVLQKMNMVFSHSNDVTFMTDKAGIITFINPKFTEIYGYTPNEIIGKVTPRILNSTTEEQKFKKFWKKILNKESISDFAYTNKCKNGSLISMEGSVDPIIDSNNELIGFLAIQKDISERLRNEKIQNVLHNISNAVHTTHNLTELLKLIQFYLSSIIDTTNFYIALFNSEKDEITMPFFTDEVDKLKSFPEGKTLTEYVIKTKKPLLASAKKLNELVHENQIEIIGTFPKIWLGVPLLIDKVINGVIVLQSYKDSNAFTKKDEELLVFASDQISLSIQNKKIEEDLKIALEKATESDKLKTAFLQNISHEIRTPMNGILGFSSLLKDPELSGEKQQAFIDIITKSGERMLNTLNDLMDLSKLETGQVHLRLTKIHVNEELEMLYSFFKPEAQTKNLYFNLNNPVLNASPSIETDKEKLYAILSNLIKNAIKYSKYGGIDFGYTQKQDFLEFYVLDSGIGIAEHRKNAIFERFIQADIHDSDAYDGAGLGLSISKSYVEMLGGKIWVDSTVGQGSKFYFTIPLNTSLQD